jgi:hypothetical protein
MQIELKVTRLEWSCGTLKVEFEEPKLTPADLLKRIASSDTEIDFGSSKVLYISDIALKLRKSPKQIDKLSRRKKHPLPLVRGRGRPYIFESALHAWLVDDPSEVAVVRRFLERLPKP